MLFQHVCLSIFAGQRIGLVGASGSGKSSLLRAIAMLDRCDKGEVLFHGNTIGQDSVPNYRRRVIYLLQRPAFVSGSVRENLQIPYQLAVAESTFDEARVTAWLSDLGRSPQLLDQAMEQLSGGEQQVVALIRALTLSPEVLLLDEPTASLDAKTATQFEGLVNAWHGEGTERAFIWVSHDMNQVTRMTDQTLVMRDGILRENDDSE